MRLAEYRSQAQQDAEESGRACGASCGPLPFPGRPQSITDELLWRLRDSGCHITEVVLDEAGVLLRGAAGADKYVGLKMAREWMKERNVPGEAAYWAHRHPR